MHHATRPSLARRGIAAGATLAVIILAAARPAPQLSEESRARAEVSRLRAHFDSVERELSTRDVSELTAAQRAARQHHIQVLREYSARGVFPHNHDIANARVPSFRDAHGTLCAMAQLIAESGRTDIVDRVASTRNNAYIAELIDDPSLVAWLDSAGLTAAEAARIQPTYGGPGYITPIASSDREVTVRYAMASMAAVGFGGGAIALNLQAPSASRRPWREILGLGAGALGVGLASTKLNDGGTVAAIGATNGIVGVASIALATRNLLHRPARPIATATRAPLALTGERYDRLAAARGYGLTR